MRIRKYQNEGIIQRNDATTVSKPFVTNLPIDDNRTSTTTRNYMLRKRSKTNEQKERDELYRRAHYTGTIEPYNEEAHKGWMELDPVTGEPTWHAPTIVSAEPLSEGQRMWRSPALNLALNIPLGELAYIGSSLSPKTLLAAKKAYSTPTLTVNNVESRVYTGGRRRGIHKDKGLSTPFTELQSFAILEPAKRHAESKIIKPLAQTSQTDQTLYKDLPGTSDSWYRVVDDDTFKSYVANGVVSLYTPEGELVSRWPNPMFTHGFIADQRRVPGHIVLVSKPNTSLVFDGNVGPGVTPLLNGKANAAPLSEFDIFKITPLGFVKVGADYSTATEVPDYISYLKTLPFNERVAIYREAGIDVSGAEWSLRNRPSGLLFHLEKSGIPVPSYNPSLVQEDLLTEIIPSLLKKPYVSPKLTITPAESSIGTNDPINEFLGYIDNIIANRRLGIRADSGRFGDQLYRRGFSPHVFLDANNPNLILKVLSNKYDTVDELLAAVDRELMSIKGLPLQEPFNFEGYVVSDNKLVPVFSLANLQSLRDLPVEEFNRLYGLLIADKLAPYGYKLVSNPGEQLIFSNGKSRLTSFVPQNAGLNAKGELRFFDLMRDNVSSPLNDMVKWLINLKTTDPERYETMSQALGISIPDDYLF